MPGGRIPDGPRVTLKDIVSVLQQLNIARGHVVYMHSSLSSMGHVEGGADTVIDAFLHVLGPEGTFCVPTIVYAAQGPRPPFDVEQSPSEVGRITETLRLRPDAHRSINPTHSVAAIGAQAKAITTGHDRGRGRPSPWGELAFGYESPWQRFYDLDATCVLLGVDWEVNSMFHYVQARFIEPYWSELAVSPPFPNFNRTPVGNALEAAGIARKRRIGSATVTCVESRPMVDTSLEVLEKNPAGVFEEGEQSSYVRWYRSVPKRRRRLKAGATRLTITPSPDLAGEARVLEPLHARALVLEHRERTAAIVVCDLYGLDRRYVVEARRLIERQTGIPAAHVLISCTHNHAGSDTVRPLDEAAEQYYSYVVGRIAEAVAAARDQTQEARAGTAHTLLEGIAQNRRLRLSEGRVITLRRFVPSSWQLYRKGDYEAGPVDRDLTVLRIEALDGAPLALLSTLGCHNDTGGMFSPVGISADFFGHAMLTLERLYPGCTAMIGFGAGGGDVDFDFVPYVNLSRARSEYPLQRFGRLLAAQVAAAFEQAEVDDGGYLDIRSHNVPFRLRPEVRHLLPDIENPTGEVQAIQIGNLAVIGVPGEIFAETALEIRQHLPVAQAIIVGLANDDLGYLPPPSAYREGGYEIEPHVRSRMDDRAEPVLKKTISSLLEEMASERTRQTGVLYRPTG